MNEPELIVLGHCTNDSVVILIADDPLNNEQTAKARIAYTENDGTIKHKDLDLTEATPFVRGVLTLDGLTSEANIKYAIQIVYNNDVLDSANNIFSTLKNYLFHLLKDSRPIKFGLLSCNRTKLYSDHATQYKMWVKLLEAIEENEVDLLIHAGDQIYADNDHNISQNYYRDIHRARSRRRYKGSELPDKDSLVKEYRQAYYDSWTQPETAQVLRSCPSIMMWDDHDIVDGWGAQGWEDRDEMQQLYLAAEQAFKEFQICLNPRPLDEDSSFATGFVYDTSAFLMLDTRKNRRAKNGVILGNQQFVEMKKWLNNLPDTIKYLYIVQPKPMVFGDMPGIPGFITKLIGSHDDLQEFWTSKKNLGECARLLMTMFDYAVENPFCKVCILSGDLHVSYVAEIESHLPKHQIDGSPIRIHEIVSSGIGNKAPKGIPRKIFMSIIDEQDDKIKLVDSDITGKILSIGDHHLIAEDKIIASRNFAIIKPTDASGNNADAHNHLWVEYYVEDIEKPLEKCLFQLHSENDYL